MLLMFNQGKVYGVVTWTYLEKHFLSNFDQDEYISKRLNPHFSDLKTFLRCSKKDYTYLKPISCQSFIKRKGKLFLKLKTSFWFESKLVDPRYLKLRLERRPMYGFISKLARKRVGSFYRT